jgi:hypothetical protein
MDRRQAISFIRYHGVVLEAARGLEPSLAKKVVGGPIRGSWWGHHKGHEIYELTQEIHDSKVVLTCSLAGGRITYIHRRLWPHFIRMACSLPLGALDQVREVHLPSGRHKREDVPFPEWVPDDVLESSKWLERYGDA